MKLDKEQLIDIISDIMINHGPNGHCDGANVIANFVEALLVGNSQDWLKDYFSTNKKYFYESESS